MQFVFTTSWDNPDIGKLDWPAFFLGGDPRDEVFDLRLINTGCPLDLSIGPNGTCEFLGIAQTRDLLPNLSGTDVGLWKIQAGASVLEDTDTASATAFIEVRDPNAQTTIPEPAGVMLVSGGLLALIVVASSRRFKGDLKVSMNRNMKAEENAVGQAVSLVEPISPT